MPSHSLHPNCQQTGPTQFAGNPHVNCSQYCTTGVYQVPQPNWPCNNGFQNHQHCGQHLQANAVQGNSLPQHILHPHQTHPTVSYPTQPPHYGTRSSLCQPGSPIVYAHGQTHMVTTDQASYQASYQDRSTAPQTQQVAHQSGIQNPTQTGQQKTPSLQNIDLIDLR